MVDEQLVVARIDGRLLAVRNLWRASRIEGTRDFSRDLLKRADELLDERNAVTYGSRTR